MNQPSSGAGHGLAPVPDRAATQTASPAGPGVPLSVWPGLPARGGIPPGLPCGGLVSTAAARQLIESFSRPGDLVAADGSPAVIEAAAAAGRAVIALTPGGHPPAGLARPDTGVRLRPEGPALLLTSGGPDAGQAALAVTGCHGPGCCAEPGTGGEDGRERGLLYAACERVLRPGGVLAVITASQVSDGPLAGVAGGAVAAARAAGLVYTQHIVLVHAAIDGDRLDPGDGSAVPGTAAPPGGNRVHSDLLVFTKPGGPRP